MTLVDTPIPAPHPFRDGDRVHLRVSALEPLTDEEYAEGRTLADRYRYPGTITNAFRAQWSEQSPHARTVLVRFDGIWEVGDFRGCEMLVDVDDIEALP
jgi:hypothetical protein